MLAFVVLFLCYLIFTKFLTIGSKFVKLHRSKYIQTTLVYTNELKKGEIAKWMQSM